MLGWPSNHADFGVRLGFRTCEGLIGFIGFRFRIFGFVCWGLKFGVI